MAAFKVGQRVKRIRNMEHAIPLGATGVITGFSHVLVIHEEAFIRWDDAALNVRWSLHSFAQETLAPLIDPKADEFIERIKKLKPYEEPVVAEELFTELLPQYDRQIGGAK